MKNLFSPLLIIMLVLSTVSDAFADKHSFPVIEYIENQGQWVGDFKYKALTERGDFYVKNNGFRVVLADGNNKPQIHAYRHGAQFTEPKLTYYTYDMNFVNSNPNTSFTHSKKQSHYYNYYLGNDAKSWKSGIYPSLNVDMLNVYNGIDVHMYSDQGNIKYDYVIHAGANYNDIKVQYDGTQGISVKDGKLFIKTSLGEVTEMKPYTYQFINGEKKEIGCNYKIKDENIVSFEVGKGYNPTLDLYIDPTLIFCTFTGSTADNWGFTATYDTLGMFYAGGVTSGIGYPVTLGVYQPTYGGGGAGGNGFQCDASFSKFSSNGTTLLFATYLGGSNNDQPQSMIVDGNGNLGIAGRTYSVNFPTSAGCYDNTANGGADMFVAVLNSTGTALVGSTYIGGAAEDGVNFNVGFAVYGGVKHNYGDDARTEIIVDNTGRWYVAGCTQSSNFPTVNPTQNTNAGGQDAVVFEMSNNCSNLIWSTYMGGNANDAAYVLSLDKNTQNFLYVGGGTESANFPSTPGTYLSTYQGGTVDGYLLRFDANSKALLAGTFIGTNQYDQVYGVQTDDSNHVYATGQTMGAFPVSPAGVYSNPGSSQFVIKLNSALAGPPIFSTVYGSGTTVFTNISPTAFLVDKCENIYVSGWGGPTAGSPGNTNNMPLSNTPGFLPIQNTTDGSDFYFIVFSKNAQNLLYATYFGQNGIAPNGLGGEHVDGGTSRFDPNGVVYQAICANCGGGIVFPTQPAGVYSINNPSPNCNLAALKIAFDLLNPDAVAAAAGPLYGCVPFQVTFQNNSTSATSFSWDFGDGSPLDFSAVPPPHTYNAAGIYTVTLIASNPNGCTVNADTTQLVVTVIDDSMFPGFTFIKIDSCGPFSIQITNTSSYNNGIPSGTATYTWDFGDGTTYTGQFPPVHNYPAPATYTITLTMTDPDACNNPATAQVVVDFSTSIVKSAFIMPDSVCLPALIGFIDQSTNATTWNWIFGDGNTSNIQNPTNNYLSIGTYTIFLVSGNPNTCNLFDTSSKVLTVLSTPVADFTWSPNPPEPNTPNVFTNLSTGATKYLWDFGDGTTGTNKDEIHIYDKDGTYTVCLTATNEYGCRDTVCKSVRGIVVPLVDVPSGFSPNGDGINDIVYVKGYGIAKMTFRIFNRWGEKVFESTEKSKGWDGRYKGVMQEMEAYAYTLAVEFFDGTKANKKGNITLLK